MLETKAVFFRKEADFRPKSCVIEKVIRLSGAEYDSFARNMLRDQAFIRDNPIDAVVDANGRYHCLLVTGEGRRDGILVNPEGGDYARYSAFIPNAEDFLAINRYPALAMLNEKLTAIVDIFAEQAGAGSSEGYGAANLQNWGAMFGIDLTPNGALLNTVMDMLRDRPEVKNVVLNGNELVIYRERSGESVDAANLEQPVSEERPSVIGQIKAARQTPRIPAERDVRKPKRDKGGPEL